MQFIKFRWRSWWHWRNVTSRQREILNISQSWENPRNRRLDVPKTKVIPVFESYLRDYKFLEKNVSRIPKKGWPLSLLNHQKTRMISKLKLLKLKFFGEIQQKRKMVRWGDRKVRDGGVWKRGLPVQGSTPRSSFSLIWVDPACSLHHVNWGPENPRSTSPLAIKKWWKPQEDEIRTGWPPRFSEGESSSLKSPMNTLGPINSTTKACNWGKNRSGHSKSRDRERSLANPN